MPQDASAEIKVRHNPEVIGSDTQKATFIFTSDQGDFRPSEEYTFNVSYGSPTIGINNFNEFVTPQSASLLEVSFGNRGLRTGQWNYELCLGKSFVFSVCNDKTRIRSGSFTVFKSGDLPAIAMERYNFRAQDTATVYILNADPRMEYRFWFEGENTVFTPPLFSKKFSQNEIASSPYHAKTAIAQINIGDASSKPKALCMTYQEFFFGANAGTLACDFRLGNIVVTNTTPSSPGGFIQSNEVGAPKPVAPTIFVPAPIPPPPCDLNAKSCPTAFGDISTDPAGFISRVFGILLSLAGGIALLLIIISGYRLMASQGNPEKVQAAREQLTSAIVGLLFIIFSLAILTIVGVDILRIPGFGG